MSAISEILGAVAEDAREAANAPVETVKDARYTLEGVRKGRVSPNSVLKTAGITAGAVVVVAILLFPLYWVAVGAFSGTGASLYSSSGIRLWPAEPTFEPFLWVIGDLILPSYRISLQLGGYELFVQTPELAFLDVSNYGVTETSDFKKFFVNSLTVAIPTVLLAMCLIVPGAYALSRRKFIGRSKVLYGYVLFTQIGGGLGVALLIALYALFVQFGFNDSKLALSAYYAATAVPFNTWLLKTYMDGIPVSYEEAAMMDGAPSWKIVTEIILPLSKAGLATVFIFTFLTGWTEFVVAQTLLSTDNYTLPVGLYSLVGRYSIPWARFSAFALTFAAPIMLIYLFAQRYIEGGLSFGGMEG
ncbi:sugar ABC transporter permease [Haloferax sp. DFSO60]|uniref:sugar ABC transporter permease n=1 Tax=Haloferax sp. DFSO60 TaxID=3388652 RepID=UPI00397C7237